MTKSSDQYRTDPKLFKELGSVNRFFWDACCDYDNALCEATKLWMEKNSHRDYNYLELDLQQIVSELELPNSESIFMNPPYSNPMPFIKKAWEDSLHFRVVMLLKADMSTDWFNYALESRNIDPTSLNQRNMSLRSALWHLEDMMNNQDELNDEFATSNHIGILHLRKRLKFYVSEEVIDKDYQDYKLIYQAKMEKVSYDKDKGHLCKMLETKNYKRVEDGIVSKNTANFPSMLLIFDRRR